MAEPWWADQEPREFYCARCGATLSVRGHWQSYIAQMVADGFGVTDDGQPQHCATAMVDHVDAATVPPTHWKPELGRHIPHSEDWN